MCHKSSACTCVLCASYLYIHQRPCAIHTLTLTLTLTLLGEPDSNPGPWHGSTAGYHLIIIMFMVHLFAPRFYCAFQTSNYNRWGTFVRLSVCIFLPPFKPSGFRNISSCRFPTQLTWATQGSCLGKLKRIDTDEAPSACDVCQNPSFPSYNP